MSSRGTSRSACSLTTDIAPENRNRIVRDLIKKYGKPDATSGEETECRHPLTGALIMSAQEMSWTKPNLHVRYTPIGAGYTYGRILVDLDYLEEWKASLGGPPRPEPKM